MSAEIHSLAAYVDSQLAPKPVLRCNGCGTTTEAACDCNVGYHPVKAVEAAMKAVAANPNASNRMIAEKIGVSKDTVRLARNEVADNSPPEKREGLDGKSYPAKPAPKPPASTIDFNKKKKAAAKERRELLDGYRNAFIIRADGARQLARTLTGRPEAIACGYKVDDQMIKYAEAAATAWRDLVEEMKSELAGAMPRAVSDEEADA